MDEDSNDDEEEGDDDDEEREDKSELLSRTLSSSPKLGRLVKRLILITLHHEYWTTEEHIQIVKHCTELEDLKILGYSIKLLTEYKAAIAALCNLRSLTISAHSLSDQETDAMMDDGEALIMVQRFPRMEELQIPANYGSIEDGAALKAYCQSRGIKLSHGFSNWV